MDKTRIMIVEDEGITSAYIESTLKQLGFTVSSIESSSDMAIEKAEEDNPDLILMDIHINGTKDGIVTAEEIQTRFNIPVVYLTAHSDEATLERAKLTDPFGYVLKPLDPKDLRVNIELAMYKHKMQNKLKELAHYDLLTGLPNRTLLFDRLDQALKNAKRNNMKVAVLMIDLDGFKCINDRMGHDTGDEVLKEIAQRLKHNLRDSDTVARFGGDEFITILSNLSAIIDAETLALKMIVEVGKPFHFNTPYCALGASIGISFYPEDGYDAETLLKKADTAMYRAKENGKNNYQLFNEISRKIKGDIKGALFNSLKFVLKHKEGWGHNDWVKLLEEFQVSGFFISKTVEAYIGTILEILKQFYILEISDKNVEVRLSRICEETAGFILTNKGIWILQDWNVFLAKLESDGIILNKKASLLLLDLIEATKALYVFYC